MATARPSAGAGPTGLELNGQFAGGLRSLQPPGYRVDPVVAPLGPGGAARLAAHMAITEMAAEFEPGQAPALLDWALTLPHGRAAPVDGAALVLDHNDKEQRRIAWTDGLLTALQLPTLDAASRLPFTLGLRWQPGTVAYPKASGAAVPGAVGPRKKGPLLCNFRVLGLPFDGQRVLRVALPGVSARLAEQAVGAGRLPARHQSAITLGELRLDFPPSQRDEVLAWVGRVIQDGVIADGEYLQIGIELLDATLKKPLLTLTLGGCGLLGYDEAPIGGSEGAATVSLRLGVAQLDMKQGG